MRRTEAHWRVGCASPNNSLCPQLWVNSNPSGLGMGPAPPPRKNFSATKTNSTNSLQPGPLRHFLNPHRCSSGGYDGPPSNPLGRGDPDAPVVATIPHSNFVSVPLLSNLDTNLTSKLNIIRNPIRIATWNVLTLNPPGQSTLLSSELSRLNVAFAGLQETRWRGSGETRIGDYKLVWSGHDTDRINGVALALNKESAAALERWEPLSSRLLYARLKHSQGFASILVCLRLRLRLRLLCPD